MLKCLAIVAVSIGSRRGLPGAEGRSVTDDYSDLRRKLLIAAIDNIVGFSDRLQEAARTLNLLIGIYEEVSRVAATHRHS